MIIGPVITPWDVNDPDDIINSHGRTFGLTLSMGFIFFTTGIICFGCLKRSINPFQLHQGVITCYNAQGMYSTTAVPTVVSGYHPNYTVQYGSPATYFPAPASSTSSAVQQGPFTILPNVDQMPPYTACSSQVELVF